MPLCPQETEREVSTRPTRSGCVSSIPVSMTPTVTGACAIGTAAASVALIAWAPQLTTSSGLSASVALCPRMEDGPPDCAPD